MVRVRWRFSYFLAAPLAAGFKVPYLGTTRWVLVRIPCDALICEAKCSPCVECPGRTPVCNGRVRWWFSYFLFVVGKLADK